MRLARFYDFSLAGAGEIVYTNKTERKPKMAIKKETAGKTAKKEPKAATPKTETPKQEAPKIEVKTVAVPKEIADQLQKQRLDIVMLVTTVRTLIGMCDDEKEVKILTKQSKVCVETARAVSKLMVSRHSINSLETLGMTTFLVNEVAPLAFEAVDKAEAEAAKAAAPKKKEVK